MSGIEITPDEQQLDIYQNPRGRPSCQARIGYRGPISPRGKSTPRIKLDLTADECVVLAQKCECKGIRTPVLADMQSHRVDLEGGWKSMLAHQLPALPPVETFWSELPDFFSWMEDRGTPQTPAAFAGAPGEEVIHEHTQRLSLPGAARSHLENIRFAASNRLVVELDYQGSTRRIEPYSVRRTRDGNIILHAHNLDRNQHRGYRVDRIQGARVTAESFAPRYAVELTPRIR